MQRGNPQRRECCMHGQGGGGQILACSRAAAFVTKNIRTKTPAHAHTQHTHSLSLLFFSLFYDHLLFLLVVLFHAQSSSIWLSSSRTAKPGMKAAMRRMPAAARNRPWRLRPTKPTYRTNSCSVPTNSLVDKPIVTRANGNTRQGLGGKEGLERLKGLKGLEGPKRRDQDGRGGVVNLYANKRNLHAKAVQKE